MAPFPFGTLLIRTVGEATEALRHVRRVLAAVDPDLAIEAAPLAQELEGRFTEPRFLVAIIGALGALAMTLTCVGLYSVLSYTVSQRTREVGVRMALGARASDVRQMVMAGALLWLIGGVVVGVPLGLALTQLLQSRIWGLSRPGWPIVACGIVTVLSVGLVACWVPARRATQIDPIVALRCE